MSKIRDEFKVHLLNSTGIERAGLLAQCFSEFLTEIELLVPPGRPMSLVKTKLEEAAFFAKRGLAELKENQLAEPGPNIMKVAEDWLAGTDPTDGAMHADAFARALVEMDQRNKGTT